MGVHDALAVFRVLITFWRGLLYFLIRGKYSSPGFLEGEPLHCKAQLYSLAMVIRTWGAPDYDGTSVGAALADRFRDIAIPCTGVPLKFVCVSRFVAFAFLFLIYPWLAFLNSLRKRLFSADLPMYMSLRGLLLEPKDRLSLWIFNCALTSLHCRRTQGRATGYLQEDSFAFLETSSRLGIPVPPCYKSNSLVVKGRDGTREQTSFYRNAANGGRWVFQEHLENDAFMSSLLPAGAPLSTLLVVTVSRGGGLARAESSANVTALSCVLRAGRAGAESDATSSAVIFGVDLSTGLIGRGLFGSSWNRGLRSLACLREPQEPYLLQHPDSGARIAGRTVPDIGTIQSLCVDAHCKLAPDVPLASWDVGLTNRGRLLLKVRFSVDFVTTSHLAAKEFSSYLLLVDEYYRFLDGDRIVEKFSELRLEPM